MTQQILWSGGFDSTYMVMSSLLDGHRVQGVFMQHDMDWQKQLREREAIDRITSAIPFEIRRRLDLKPYPIPQSTWDRYWTLTEELRKRINNEDYSTQLPMLGAMAEAMNGVDVGIVKEDFTASDQRLVNFLQDHQVKLPILKMGKQEMLDDAKIRGFDDLLRLTWSCEGTNDQANDAPCGTCTPCQLRIIPVDPVFLKIKARPSDITVITGDLYQKELVHV